MRLGAVILAAGAATRMGQIKQLLPFRGGTLVEHAVRQAQQAEFDPVVVVLGAQAELVREAVLPTGAAWIVNADWESGMGSSLRCGVARILEMDLDLEALAVLLADQPFVTAKHLRQMGREFEQQGAPILAALYGGTVGVPAIFGSSVFAKLMTLPPDAGARALLRGGEAEVQRYELPEAATDIDTPADFAAIE